MENYFNIEILWENVQGFQYSNYCLECYNFFPSITKNNIILFNMFHKLNFYAIWVKNIDKPDKRIWLKRS